MKADSAGKLTSLGTVPTGKGPVSVDTDGFNVYVANSLDSTISCYEIVTGGKLSLSSTIPTGSNPRSIVGLWDISDSTFYAVSVVCGGNQVIVYNVNPGPSLVERGRSTVGSNPVAVASGYGAVFSADFDGGTISGVDLSPVAAASTPKHTVGSGPIAIAERHFATDGTAATLNGLHTLYALNSKSNSITVFQENTGDGVAPGTLISLGTIATGQQPIAFSTSLAGTDDFPGDAIYCLNSGTETISVLPTDPKTAKGRASRAANRDVTSGSKPADLKNMQTSSGPKVVYVSTQGGTIRRYAAASDQSLTFLDEVPTGGTGTVAMAVTPLISGTAFAIDATLPSGTVGKAYSAKLTANENQLYDWTVTQGSLPPGLAMSGPSGDNEILAGTPTQAGSFTFTLQVENRTDIATKQYTVVIAKAVNEPLSIATSSLANGTVGTAYNGAPLRVSGGDGSQSAQWSVSSGALPAGLGLVLATNNVDVSIQGTPTTAGTSTFTLEADQGSKTATKSLSITVAPATAGGTSVRFLNADTDSSDKSLTFTLEGAAFPATSFGSISGPKALASGSSVPYLLVNGSGASLPSGKTFVSDGKRNIMVELGVNDATRKLAFMFFGSDFPGNIGGGLAFMNGAAASGQPVDAYLLDDTGAVVAQQGNISYGGFTSFAATPGTYQIKVTAAGFPDTVLAITPMETVAGGQNILNVVISPADGGAATFVHLTE